MFGLDAEAAFREAELDGVVLGIADDVDLTESVQTWPGNRRSLQHSVASMAMRYTRASPQRMRRGGIVLILGRRHSRTALLQHWCRKLHMMRE